MHKVICEAPRHGGGRIKQQRRANRTEDQLPSYDGMKRLHNAGSRYLAGRDGPLKRWLRSKLGMHWNDVFHEAAQVFRMDDFLGRRFRSKMMDMVELNTFMRDGEVWCLNSEKWFATREQPVCKHSKREQLFYVHPESGALLAIPDSPRELTLSEKEVKEFGAVRKWLPKDFLLLKLKGLWFECRMVRYQAHWQYAPFDVVFGAQLIDSHAREAYGEPFYCSRKRQLSRKELRARGLANSKSAADCFLNVLGDGLIGRIRRSHGNPVRCWLQFRIHLWIEASAVF